MDLTITGKNLEINDTIRKYVEKKIGRLDRYLPNIIDGRVELTVDEGARAAEDRQIAQVTLRTKKVILRAEEASSDIFASIDAVFEKMQRQVDRYKGKRRDRRRGAGAQVEPGVAEAEAEEAEAASLQRAEVAKARAQQEIQSAQIDTDREVRGKREERDSSARVGGVAGRATHAGPTARPGPPDRATPAHRRPGQRPRPG